MGHLAASTRQPEAIELPLPWGPVVRGLRWGAEPDTVLLLHEPGADIDTWGALPAQLVSALRVSVVAIDLPGHGLSDDPWQPQRIGALVRQIVEGHAEGEAQTDRRQFVITAGHVAGATMAQSSALGLAGLVMLSPTAPPFPVEPGEGGGGTRTNIPKLFVAGSHAADDLTTARRLASTSLGWTVVTSVPVSERGTGLLAPPWGARVTEEITAFLRDCLHPRPVSRPGNRITPPSPR